MILSNKLITKLLIRLRGFAGWSAPLLFANTKDKFSCVKTDMCLPCYARDKENNGRVPLALCRSGTPKWVLWQIVKIKMK